VRLLEFAGLKHSIQFVVPNPMRAATGKTQDGKTSGRTKDNACLPSQRLFSVVEFDTCENHDIQAGRLRWLSLLHPEIPLVMVVDSAGKSLQGWFYTAQHRDKLAEFESLAIMLGADKQPLTTLSQFVRAPWGVRRNPSDNASGRYQRVRYFNPFAITKGAR